ncbi:MAG: hypothetical protein B7Y90_11425 [Alphaproteobacteria bacterium 32-64-14]|nr:MAG: hypothetical protein B7Y90_11425 [Alphaproteobacteria bacterium 32-64-14]
MRVFVLMAAGALMLAACDTTPPPAAIVAERPMPDYRPETAAACNSVGLSITYAQGGALTVNGAASNMDGLMAAATRKNAACPNAPAVVNLAVAPGVPEKDAEALREKLAATIVNFSLSEGS